MILLPSMFLSGLAVVVRSNHAGTMLVALAFMLRISEVFLNTLALECWLLHDS